MRGSKLPCGIAHPQLTFAKITRHLALRTVSRVQGIRLATAPFLGEALANCDGERIVYPSANKHNMARNQIRALLLSSFLFASLTACNVAEPEPGKEIAPGVRLVARISDPRIVESSGVIASRRYSNVFWTHNDGGGPKKQVLYAIDREGKTRAAFPVDRSEVPRLGGHRHRRRADTCILATLGTTTVRKTSWPSMKSTSRIQRQAPAPFPRNAGGR